MAAPDPGKLAINAATVRQRWKLEQLIEGCARHGIRGIGPWYDQVADLGVARAAQLIRSHDLTVTSYCRGGFFTSPGWRDENRRAIDAAAALGARCLIVVAGGQPPDSKDVAEALARTVDALAELLPEARAAGVPLAIEPQREGRRRRGRDVDDYCVLRIAYRSILRNTQYAIPCGVRKQTFRRVPL